MFLKLFILLLCIELWRQGGKKHSWLRDVLIPIILGVYIGLKTGYYWLGFFSISSFQIIRMGYGIPDETDEGSTLAQLCYKIGITKSWAIRGIAGLLYGLIGACLLISVIGVWKYLLYALINFSLNAIGEYKQWNVEIVERLAGLGIGSLMFFI